MNQQEDPLSPSPIYRAGADLMQQIHIAMIRLDTKMDNLADRVNAAQVSYDKGYRDHEERLRTLESRDYVSPATVWKVIGLILTVVSVGIGIVGMVVK